jgi:hypothetical protein
MVLVKTETETAVEPPMLGKAPIICTINHHEDSFTAAPKSASFTIILFIRLAKIMVVFIFEVLDLIKGTSGAIVPIPPP